MRYPLFAILLLASSTAYAEPIYLRCDLLSAPSYQRFSSEEQETAFIRSMILSGSAGYLVPPSKTWIIDLEHGQVRNPEAGDRFVVRNLEVSEGRIVGKTDFGSVFDLNRISLNLSYTKFLGEEGINFQGIAVPTSSTWTFQCNASKAPVV